MTKFVPQYEISFPYFEKYQKAEELYERRRFTRFITLRQSLRFRCRSRYAWRGVVFVDQDSIRPFMG